MLSVPAMICGAVTFVATENFGKSNAQWWRKFLELTCGIPSHGTLGRVFAVLGGPALKPVFWAWVQSAITLTQGQLVAIDGTTVRRSRDQTKGRAAIHRVRAWSQAGARGARMVLAQQGVDSRSNEITAIPELLPGYSQPKERIGKKTAFTRLRGRRKGYQHPLPPDATRREDGIASFPTSEQTRRVFWDLILADFCIEHMY